MDNIKIIKGNIIFTPTMKTFKTYINHYMVIEDGSVSGIYDELPKKYDGIKQIEDYSDQLIIPSFVDLHAHAPQYYQMGLGYDNELLEWLEKYTFISESNFSDLDYAKEVYNKFADELIKKGTLRACIFATIHTESTKLLFEILKQKGIGAYVGKVNMDSNCPESLRENTEESIQGTLEILKAYKNETLVKPILTPRFALTSSEELLEGIGALAEKYQLPVQSHLSENKSEVERIKELFPASKSYSDVYNTYGLFGQTPTLMAHCIYLSDDECELIKNNNVVLVHCPDSNLNLKSGIMPVRKWLNKGLTIGLGSDVGGGHSLSMSKAIVSAIQVSKIMQLTHSLEPLTITEAFYLATKGGGSFFGNIGSFEEGYSFDALVIQEERELINHLTIEERLQRFLYDGDDRNIIARYVNGVKLSE